MATLFETAYRWQPVLNLERLLPRPWMRRLRILFGVGSVAFLGLGTAAWFTPELSYELVWFALGAICVGLWLEQIMLYSYHNHRYYAGLRSIVSKDETNPPPITYDVARITMNNPSDLTQAFLTDPLGQTILKRLGVADTPIAELLTKQRERISAEHIELQNGQTFSAVDLGAILIEWDIDLRTCIEEQGITIATWNGAIHWVITEHIQNKLHTRWWAADNLLRTRGVGSSWAYGYTTALNAFSKPIDTATVFSRFATIPAYAAHKIDELSQTLVKEKAGNALIIGEAGVGKSDIIHGLAKRIYQGQSIAGLQHRRIVTLDTERILSVHESPAALEQSILTILDEALTAGNMIVAIENIGNFIQNVAGRGVSLPELLDPYLAHPDIQFIVTDTPGAFHTTLQPHGALLRRFAQIMIDIPDTASVVTILQQACRVTEIKHGVFFTYPGLVAIAQGATRYVTDGVLPDSALTLLVEVAAAYDGGEEVIITPELVYQFIKNKTGIPMGTIDEAERDVLLHLEDTLHDRVVGQDRAIDAIAKTIRRARVGIQNSERPIGSFLFLGPTGVGKTETAKTLAAVFFGSEENMVRLDMSEYSAPDAVAQLIGDGETAGSLGAALHDRPYTVLLLDEFEKAHRTVHDLFLQILDEGTFTDSRGHRVNTRNTMIIATSNAGSQLIYNTYQQRRENAVLDQRIIDHIIEKGMFRPELINRFDNTIIFEPLQREEQTQIATLMLGALRERIEQKGYKLEIAPDVSDYLLEHGYSESFGARAMRREIQDSVESVLAEQIIEQSLQPGDTIHLTKANLESAA